MKSRFLILSILFSFCVSAQNQEGSVVSIPFKLTAYNNISIQAIFNNSDTADLMFHLAVGGVSTTTKASEQLPSIHWNFSDTLKSWGGESLSKISLNNKLQIGSLKWDSVLVHQSLHSGHETDGKFGPFLFNSNFIEINFDEQKLNLHPTLPDFTTKYKAIPLIVKNGYYFIEATIQIEENLILNSYLLHSGYSETLLFDDEFAAKNGLNEKLPLLSESELKDSFGNVLKTKKSELGNFQIGEITFSNLPVSFFEGTIGKQKMSVLGMDILKRFNLLFDLENKVLYLKKSKLFREDFRE